MRLLLLLAALPLSAAVTDLRVAGVTSTQAASYMFPALPFGNCRDGSPADAKQAGDRSLCLSTSSQPRLDLADLWLRHFCHSVFLSARRDEAFWVEMSPIASASRRTALLRHVERVVPWCSEEEMIRSNTARIITGMAHKEAIWDDSKMEKPREAMRSFGFPISNRKQLVYGRSCRAKIPTGVRFGDETPESCDSQVIAIKVCGSARDTTELASSFTT